VARVLVVDDDAAIRESLRMLLEDEGFAVTAATSGDAALRELSAMGERCIAVVDLMMPGMSGGELVAAIRADPQLKSTPVCLITASSAPAAAGADWILRKPFHLDALLQVIHALETRPA